MPNRETFDTRVHLILMSILKSFQIDLLQEEMRSPNPNSQMRREEEQWKWVYEVKSFYGLSPGLLGVAHKARSVHSILREPTVFSSNLWRLHIPKHWKSQHWLVVNVVTFPCNCHIQWIHQNTEVLVVHRCSQILSVVEQKCMLETTYKTIFTAFQTIVRVSLKRTPWSLTSYVTTVLMTFHNHFIKKYESCIQIYHTHMQTLQFVGLIGNRDMLW